MIFFYWYLHGFVKPCFFQEVFRAKAPSRVHRLTPLLCLHMKLFTCCKTCLHMHYADLGGGFAWDQACLCAQEERNCVASRMCASSKNVHIPTTPDTMTAAASSMFDKKDTVCLFAQVAWDQACLCAQEERNCVASRMCASSKNVHIPTTPDTMTAIASSNIKHI